MAAKFSISKLTDNKIFKISLVVVLALAGMAALAGSIYYSYNKEQSRHSKIEAEKVLKTDPPPKVIEPIDRSNFKTVPLTDFGNSNPFNPDQTLDVPKTALVKDKDLLLPPAGDIQDSDAGLVMGTTISGILYDSNNSSAIINIEGTEYFVKQDDVVNNYKVLSIKPNQVTIKYGSNVYKAGVGELLTKVESNSNIVNLEKKFGGNGYENISIKVRKN